MDLTAAVHRSTPDPARPERTARALLRAPARALCLVAALAAGPAAADGDNCAGKSAADAQALVKDTTDKLFAAVDADRERIRADSAYARQVIDQYVGPHVDLESSSRLVLGKYWREATPEQRERFVHEFHQLILRTYTTAVTEYTGISIEYLPQRDDGQASLVTVRTRIPQQGGPGVSVNYRLHCNDGRWMLIDVTIEGVSMVTTYRSQFAGEINRAGIDGLIEALERKNKEGA